MLRKIPVTVIVIIAITYFSMNKWVFKERLEGKDDVINSQTQKIKLLKDEIKSKPETRYRNTITIYEDAKSKWGSKNLKIVTGKTFQNERVELDGYSYRNCQFIDVTFVYKGETPYHLIDIVCVGQPGFDISSSKPLSGLVRLLDATNNLKNVKVNLVNK